MKAYTDYPKHMDSFSGEIETVTVIGWDHDKRVRVIRDDGDEQDIKRGYVYRSRRRVPFRTKTLARHFPEE